MQQGCIQEITLNFDIFFGIAPDFGCILPKIQDHHDFIVKRDNFKLCGMPHSGTVFVLKGTFIKTSDTNTKKTLNSDYAPSFR